MMCDVEEVLAEVIRVPDASALVTFVGTEPIMVDAAFKEAATEVTVNAWTLGYLVPEDTDVTGSVFILVEKISHPDESAAPSGVSGAGHTTASVGTHAPVASSTAVPAAVPLSVALLPAGDDDDDATAVGLAKMERDARRFAARLAMPLLCVAHASVYGQHPPHAVKEHLVMAADARSRSNLKDADIAVMAALKMKHRDGAWLPLQYACVWSKPTAAFILPSLDHLALNASGGHEILHFLPDEKTSPTVETAHLWAEVITGKNPQVRSLSLSSKKNDGKLSDKELEAKVKVVGGHDAGDSPQLTLINDATLARHETSLWATAIAFFPKVTPKSFQEPNGPTRPQIYDSRWFSKFMIVIVPVSMREALGCTTLNARLDRTAFALSQTRHKIRHEEDNVHARVVAWHVHNVLNQCLKFALVAAQFWRECQAPEIPVPALADIDVVKQATDAEAAATQIAALMESQLKGTYLPAATGEKNLPDLLRYFLGIDAPVLGGKSGAGAPLRVIIAPPTARLPALALAPWDVLIDFSDVAAFVNPPDNEEPSSMTASMAIQAHGSLGYLGQLLASGIGARIVAEGKLRESPESVPNSWEGGLRDVRAGLPRVFAPLVRDVGSDGKRPPVCDNAGSPKDVANYASSLLQNLASALGELAKYRGTTIAVTVLAYTPYAVPFASLSGPLFFKKEGDLADYGYPQLLAFFLYALPVERSKMLLLTDNQALSQSEACFWLGRQHPLLFECEIAYLKPIRLALQLDFAFADTDVSGACYVPGASRGAWEPLAEDTELLKPVNVAAAASVRRINDLRRVGIDLLHRDVLLESLPDVPPLDAESSNSRMKRRLRAAALDFAAPCDAPVAWALFDDVFCTQHGLGRVVAQRASAQENVDAFIVHAWNEVSKKPADTAECKRLVFRHQARVGATTLLRRAAWKLAFGRCAHVGHGVSVLCAVLTPAWGEQEVAAQREALKHLRIAYNLSGCRPFVVIADRNVSTLYVDSFARMVSEQRMRSVLVRLSHSSAAERVELQRIIEPPDEHDNDDVKVCYRKIIDALTASTACGAPGQSISAQRRGSDADMDVALPIQLRVYGFRLFLAHTKAGDYDRVKDNMRRWMSQLVDKLFTESESSGERRGALRVLAYLALLECAMGHGYKHVILGPMSACLDNRQEQQRLRDGLGSVQAALFEYAYTSAHGAIAGKDLSARAGAQMNLMQLFQLRNPVRKEHIQALHDTLLPKTHSGLHSTTHVSAADRLQDLANKTLEQANEAAVEMDVDRSFEYGTASTALGGGRRLVDVNGLLRDLCRLTTTHFNVASTDGLSPETDTVSFNELVTCRPAPDSASEVGARFHSTLAPLFLQFYLQREASTDTERPFNPLLALSLALVNFVRLHGVTASNRAAALDSKKTFLHPAHALLFSLSRRNASLRSGSDRHGRDSYREYDRDRVAALVAAVVPGGLQGSDANWAVTGPCGTHSFDSQTARDSASSGAAGSGGGGKLLDGIDLAPATEVMFYGYCLFPDLGRELARLAVIYLVHAQDRVTNLVRQMRELGQQKPSPGVWNDAVETALRAVRRATTAAHFAEYLLRSDSLDKNFYVKDILGNILTIRSGLACVLAQAHIRSAPTYFNYESSPLDAQALFKTELSSIAKLALQAENQYKQERDLGGREYAASNEARLWTMLHSKLNFLWEDCCFVFAKPTDCVWYKIAVSPTLASGVFVFGEKASSRLSALINELLEYLLADGPSTLKGQGGTAHEGDDTVAQPHKSLPARLYRAFETLLLLTGSNACKNDKIERQAYEDLKRRLDEDSKCYDAKLKEAEPTDKSAVDAQLLVLAARMRLHRHLLLLLMRYQFATDDSAQPRPSTRSLCHRLIKERGGDVVDYLFHRCAVPSVRDEGASLAERESAALMMCTLAPFARELESRKKSPLFGPETFMIHVQQWSQAARGHLGSYALLWRAMMLVELLWQPRGPLPSPEVLKELHDLNGRQGFSVASDSRDPLESVGWSAGTLRMQGIAPFAGRSYWQLALDLHSGHAHEQSRFVHKSRVREVSSEGLLRWRMQLSIEDEKREELSPPTLQPLLVKGTLIAHKIGARNVYGILRVPVRVASEGAATEYGDADGTWQRVMHGGGGAGGEAAVTALMATATIAEEAGVDRYWYLPLRMEGSEWTDLAAHGKQPVDGGLATAQLFAGPEPLGHGFEICAKHCQFFEGDDESRVPLSKLSLKTMRDLRTSEASYVSSETAPAAPEAAAMLVGDQRSAARSGEIAESPSAIVAAVESASAVHPATGSSPSATLASQHPPLSRGAVAIQMAPDSSGSEISSVRPRPTASSAAAYFSQARAPAPSAAAGAGPSWPSAGIVSETAVNVGSARSPDRPSSRVQSPLPMAGAGVTRPSLAELMQVAHIDGGFSATCKWPNEERSPAERLAAKELQQFVKNEGTPLLLHTPDLVLRMLGKGGDGRCNHLCYKLQWARAHHIALVPDDALRPVYAAVSFIDNKSDIPRLLGYKAKLYPLVPNTSAGAGLGLGADVGEPLMENDAKSLMAFVALPYWALMACGDGIVVCRSEGVRQNVKDKAEMICNREDLRLLVVPRGGNSKSLAETLSSQARFLVQFMAKDTKRAPGPSFDALRPKGRFFVAQKVPQGWSPCDGLVAMRP